MEKFSHLHTEACVWKVYPSGQQSCTTMKNERERWKRANNVLPKTGDPDRWRRQAPDGWETEYGPVPLKERDRDWYDEVIVFRALTKRATGRRPFRLEWAEIIRRMPQNDVTTAEVAESCGVTLDYVSRLVALHG